MTSFIFRFLFFSMAFAFQLNGAAQDEAPHKIIMPIFPGCEGEENEERRDQCTGNEIMQYVAKNLIYPKALKKSKVEGTVMIRFVVDQVGKVTEIEILKSDDERLNASAIETTKSLPVFIPATMNGQNVKVSYSIPIAFYR